MTDAGSGPVVLRNGGDAVEIRYARRGASTSVVITDVSTGDRITLDATELESLARAPEAALRELLRRPDGDA